MGHVTVREGELVRLQLFKGEKEAVVYGEPVLTAQNQPLSEEKLLKQINKTGNTPFYFEHLTAELAGNCFVPVQALNELRRRGMEVLEAEILKPFWRIADEKKLWEKQEAVRQENSGQMKLHVSLEAPASLNTVLSSPEVDAVYLDSVGFAASEWKKAAELCHENNKRCALILPQIFRKEAEGYFLKHQELLREAGFDEFVLRSVEEIRFLKELGLGNIPMVFDANLYSMNDMAGKWMKVAGAARLTLPVELNSRELAELGAEQAELIAYGYLTVMVSAQCIVRTVEGCKKQPKLLHMKDRTGKVLPVKNHCRFCYNTIYNPSPLSLLGQESMVKRIAPSVLRLQFTIESPQQTKAVIDAYADHFRYGKETPAPFENFTRGHMKRGVE